MTTENIPPYNKICPKCNDPCAFEGIIHIQCPNERCENFDESQKKAVKQWEDDWIARKKQKQLDVENFAKEKNEEYEDIVTAMSRMWATTTGYSPVDQDGYYADDNDDDDAVIY